MSALLYFLSFIGAIVLIIALCALGVFALAVVPVIILIGIGWTLDGFVGGLFYFAAFLFAANIGAWISSKTEE